MLTDEYICKLVSYGNGQYEYEPTGQEIVRCKDCKWYTPYRNIRGEEMGEGECEGYDPCVPANHFCSRGERKESEDETV